MKRKAAVILWWVYVILLFLLVVLKFRGSFAELAGKAEAVPFGSNCSLVPFATLGDQLANFSTGWARFNIIGNTIPFIPFGVLLPAAYRRFAPFFRLAAAGLGFVLFAELFQFLTRLGSFDVDDILLNMLGILAGWLIFRLLNRNGRNKQDSHAE